MCARKYCPFGHQTDELLNDVISSYAVAGFHITAPFPPSPVCQLQKLCLWDSIQNVMGTVSDIEKHVCKFWLINSKYKIHFEKGLVRAENKPFPPPHWFIDCKSCAQGIVIKTLWMLSWVYMSASTSFGWIVKKRKICFEKGFVWAENKQFSPPHWFVNCEGNGDGISPKTLSILSLA